MTKTISTRVKELTDNNYLTIIGRLTVIFGIPVVVVLMGWLLAKADAVGSKIDDLGGRMTKLEAKVDDLSRDPYKGQDAKRDFELRDILIKQLSGRSDMFEGRLQALELANARSHR